MNQSKAPAEPVWRVIGKSVKGASHVRSGLDNQDAIKWSRPEGGDHLPLVLAVADGHGSAKHIRSKVGAELAVQQATTVLAEWLVAPADERALAHLKAIATEQLPAFVEKSWKKAVDRHLEENPLSAEEIATGGVAGATEPGQATGDPELYSLYGTTLLAVAVTPQFILYLQLGDGDILTVSSAGEVTRALERDERLVGNETTSLCQANAKDQFRVRFQRCAEPPVLIVVSTDGYANSYQGDDDFLKIGPDILNFIREEGLDALDAALEGWLDETSKNGSGDDITVGIIAHLHTLSGTEEKSGTDLTGTSVGSPGNAGASASIPTSASGRGSPRHHIRRQSILIVALCLLLPMVAAGAGCLLGKVGANGHAPEPSVGANEPQAGGGGPTSITEGPAQKEHELRGVQEHHPPSSSATNILN